MRILICDDDQNIVEQLEKFIIEFFKQAKLKVPDIQTYYNGEDLLCDPKEKDIIFIDIEMPDFNGIYIGNKLKHQKPDVLIFVITYYIEYLDDAMRFNVFRYMSKPLDKQRLFQNMKDAIQIYNSNNIKIPIETKNSVHTCATSDIIFIEAKNRTVIVYTLDEEFVTTKKLTHWLNLLDIPCFFQTHRSFIINMKYVTDFDHSLVYLFNRQYRAYLTRRKYSQFKEAYFLYLESTR